jgi:hypothetical protein
LFTALSGQAVVLPYEEVVEGEHLPVAIVPHGADAPVDTAPHRIPAQWRLIATLNTRDRDLLFSLSYALMRRFAVVDLSVPSQDEFLEILKEKGMTGSETADVRIQALLDLPFRRLGPAILLDLAAFVRERLKLAPRDVDQALANGLLAFVMPQLDDLSRPKQVRVTRFLSEHVIKDWSTEEVARLVADTFHADPEDLLATDAPIEPAELEQAGL